MGRSGYEAMYMYYASNQVICWIIHCVFGPSSEPCTLEPQNSLRLFVENQPHKARHINSPQRRCPKTFQHNQSTPSPEAYRHLTSEREVKINFLVISLQVSHHHSPPSPSPSDSLTTVSMFESVNVTAPPLAW